MKHIFLILMTLSTGLASTNIQVIDKKTGKGLPSVNITIVGTVEGANTDIEGYFNLDEKYLTNDLKFSYIGYLDTTLSYHEVINLGLVELSQDVLNVEEVEVVSSKLEWEQTDLPSIVTVLRTKDLLDQGSIEIKEALQRDPSVIVDESANGTHEISIRGSNANEVLIIYDGIPLNSSRVGGFDLSWLNLNDIETISIIKGAGTLQYGSGAFGGVVVLEPAQATQNGISLNFQNTDRDLRSYSLSDDFHYGPVRARLTYSAQERLPLGYYNEDIISTRAFINFYSTVAMKNPGNYFSLNVIDISEIVDPLDQYENKLTDKYTQLKYTGDIFGSMNFGLQALKRTRGSILTNTTDPDFGYSDDSSEELELFALESKFVSKTLINFFKLEFRRDYFQGVSQTSNIAWDHIDQHEVTLGQDWYSFTDIIKYRTDIEVPFVDYIELNTSFRYDNISLSKQHRAFWDDELYIDDDISDAYDQVSKRSGVTMSKKRKNLRYQLFYTSGTNLRYPSMNELYLRDQTTIVAYQGTQLNPELNSSSEVGLQASIQPKNQNSFIETIDFQASIYKNRYVDKIYNMYIPRALPTPINATATELSGMELSVMSSMFDDVLRIYTGRTMVDISSFTIFPNKPEFKDVAEVELNFRVGNIRLQYFQEGKQFFGGTTDNMNWYTIQLDGRENVNLYSSIKLHLLGIEYVVGLTALNLLSEEDEQNYFNQRKWTLNLGLSFNYL